MTKEQLKELFPELFMSEKEIKERYDGKICGVCGKPFNYKIIISKDGTSRKIYPHGRWEAIKAVFKRFLGKEIH